MPWFSRSDVGKVSSRSCWRRPILKQMCEESTTALRESCAPRDPHMLEGCLSTSRNVISCRRSSSMTTTAAQPLAVCSEVLEHVDQPEVLLRNAADYLAPGCRLVVTVPGGPRSAFDRHIGHRRHFTARRLRRLLEESGFEDVTVRRAGFPFFDLYRLLVIARGKRLIADVEQSKADWGGHVGNSSSVLQSTFRYNLDSSPFGWQLLAVARRSADPLS